jgi:hypothetical protein
MQNFVVQILLSGRWSLLYVLLHVIARLGRLQLLHINVVHLARRRGVATVRYTLSEHGLLNYTHAVPVYLRNTPDDDLTVS